jgi:indolepyruvate ferredoxin oxidoreductase alpha subunit
VPDKVHDILSSLWPDLLEKRPKPKEAAVGARPPQLCPGCGHRSAFHAIKQALSKEDISVADIGCHTLGFLPPYKMGSVLLSMGHSTATASGLALAGGSRNVVCFLGDSTFFHAGLPGIINSVYNKHRVTLIVMENGTTAMTGHQDHPGTGNNFSEVTEKLSIRSVLEALGVAYIREVDTYQQAKLASLVKEALEAPGFKVIIARHPCMLKFTKEARRKEGWKSKHVFVNKTTCTKAHICISSFGCPSFQFREEGSVEVQNELCIGDGSCRQTCPSSAIEPEGGTK